MVEIETLLRYIERYQCQTLQRNLPCRLVADKSHVLLQITPFPSNQRLQPQPKPNAVSLQVALPWQSWVASTHSLTPETKQLIEFGLVS